MRPWFSIGISRPILSLNRNALEESDFNYHIFIYPMVRINCIQFIFNYLSFGAKIYPLA